MLLMKPGISAREPEANDAFEAIENGISAMMNDSNQKAAALTEVRPTQGGSNSFVAMNIMCQLK